MNGRSLEFVIPGDLEAASGGYEYDRRIISGLRTLGWQVSVHALDASFPEPSAAALTQARALFARLPEQSLVLIDGLALGAMPQVVLPHAGRLRLIGLVHHPLAAESGLAPHVARRLASSERQALEATRYVLVTSHATKRALLDYAVLPERVSVVEPGTDAVVSAQHVRGAELQLLCVASLIPRKGHDLLFAALAPLATASWHLTCIGSLTRSPPTTARLRAQLRRLGLDNRVTLGGEADAAALARCYARADLFVLATRFEGYGMAVAEALANGLPVISTRVGAIGELVGGGAGLLVAPDDAEALRAALSRVLNDQASFDSLVAGAAAVRRTLPDWQQACERMSHVLQDAL